MPTMPADADSAVDLASGSAAILPPSGDVGREIGPGRRTRLPSVPAVGLLVPSFPSRTQGVFWRQATMWRQAGATVDLLSTRRPSDEAAVGVFAERARQETRYLWPPAAGDVLGRLALSPRRLKLGLGYVRSLRESRLRDRVRALGLLAAAAGLVRYCRDRNVRHVHAHSFADCAHLCRVARLFGGPTYSLTLHGDLPAFGTDHKAKLAACTAIACEGPHLVEPLVALGFPAERILVSWTGVDPEALAGDPPIDRADGTFRVVTVGQLRASKGHRFAIAAIARLCEAGRDVTYTIVGDGPDRAALQDEARRAGLGDRVRFLGPVAEGEVLRELRASDAFVLPSVGLGEAGPVSTMEAMAIGLPVVASRIGATPAMIEDGVTGFLVEQEDVASLARRLGELASDAALRQRLGTAARQHAADRFDARRAALRLFDHVRRWTPETFNL